MGLSYLGRCKHAFFLPFCIGPSLYYVSKETGWVGSQKLRFLLTFSTIYADKAWVRKSPKMCWRNIGMVAKLNLALWQLCSGSRCQLLENISCIRTKCISWIYKSIAYYFSFSTSFTTQYINYVVWT